MARPRIFAQNRAALVCQSAHAVAKGYLLTEAGRLSVPTVEHYLPLLYVLGAARPEDRLRTVCEEIQSGSIAMRTFLFGE